MAKKEFTIVVVQPLSASRAAQIAKFLTEQTAKQEGFDANAIPRELRPDEAYRLAYPPAKKMEAI